MYLFLFLTKGWGQKKLSKTMCFRILSGPFSFPFNAFLGPQGSLVLPLMFRPFPRPCQFLFLCQFLLLPQLLILPPFQPHHPVSPITLVIHIMGSYLFCFMSASESVQGGFLSSCPFVCICISFFKKNQQHLLLFLMGFQGLRLGQAFPSLPAQQPHSIVSLSNLCYKLKSNVIRFWDFDLNDLNELNV